MKTILLKPKLIPEFKRAQPLPVLAGDPAGRRGMAAAPIRTRIADSLALRLEAFTAKPCAARLQTHLGGQFTGLAA